MENKEIKQFTGVKLKDNSIEVKSTRLKKKPKRKSPKYDFEEGLYTGLVQAWSISLLEAFNAPLSGLWTLAKTIPKVKQILEKLVNDYSYGPEIIEDIFKGAGIKNPQFFLEFIMSNGDPKERECSNKDCVIIMTNEILMKSFDCGRHDEKEES